MKPSNLISNATQSTDVPRHSLTITRSIAASVVAVLLATGVTLTSGTAFAASESAPNARAAAAKLDTDGDKRISRAEAAARPGLAKHFDDIDSNRDGYLSPEELQAYRQKQMGARLKAIDTNGDGKISRAEADAKAPRLASHFDKLDTNKDGFVSREELAAHAKQHRGRQ